MVMSVFGAYPSVPKVAIVDVFVGTMLHAQCAQAPKFR